MKHVIALYIVHGQLLSTEERGGGGGVGWDARAILHDVSENSGLTCM